MHPGQWAGQLASSVSATYTQAICELLSLDGPPTQAVLRNLRMGNEELAGVCAPKFQASRMQEAEKWATIATEHLRAALHRQRGDAAAATQSYTRLAKALATVYDKADPDEWLDGVVIQCVHTLTLLARGTIRAQNANRSAAASGAAPGANAQADDARVPHDASQGATKLRALASRKDQTMGVKGPVLLSTTVQLYKLLFAMGSVFLMKDLDNQLKHVDINQCPVADRCGYQFFQGFLEVLEEHWEAAEKHLTLALHLCDRRSAHNASCIVSYLVPVQALRGALPQPGVLQRYSLEYYEPVVEALRAGDTVALRSALDAERVRFIRRGVFLAVEKLPVLCFRTLLKRVHEAQLELGGHATQISLAVVTAAVVAIGDEAVDIDEVQSMVAMLINKRLVKGYIALPQQILVVQKGGPKAAFPAIANTNWR